MSAQPPGPPRTASAGPGNTSAMGAPAPPSQGGSQGSNSQQNLNQIVLEYLSKKGYSRTEAMLRRESTTVDTNGIPGPPRDESNGRAYIQAFQLLSNWVDNVLDIYKSELKRLLWPVFAYSFLHLIGEYYPRDAELFFKRFRDRFEVEHSDDLRVLGPITDPEHARESDLAKLYRNNRYRINLSQMAYATLLQFLESREADGGRLLLLVLTNSIDVHVVDRSVSASARGLQKLLALRNGEEDVPGEEEGLPGHHSGPTNRTAATQRPDKLRLGSMPMDQDLIDDVKADLIKEDIADPPTDDRPSLVEQFEQNIKVEEDEAPPPIPFPPSTARDVAMEVQRIKENRDRFKIEKRTGGVGPGISITMFTFHNTFDSINCIEFSGDNTLVAAGTAESYIRVWSLDNRTLTSPQDPPQAQPSTSRRLIGHSGPVYALSFSPSIASPTPQTNGHIEASTNPDTLPLYLASSSADGTIRLWSLATWSNVVVYSGHDLPVWDVRFSPHGHYFISGSADRTARLWSTPQVGPLRMFVGHDSDVETVAWHPNGAYAFTGSGGADRTIRMWSIATGTEVRLFAGHIGNVTAISCAPSGRMVASADDRGEIILWDLQTGRLIKRMRGHGRGGVWSLDWSVESTVLVSGGADRTVRVWDIQHNKEAQAKTAADGTAVAKTETAKIAATSTINKSGKAKKDVVVSADQISAFPTKNSPVYKVRFTQMNLVMAGGLYLP